MTDRLDADHPAGPELSLGHEASPIHAAALSSGG